MSTRPADVLVTVRIGFSAPTGSTVWWQGTPLWVRVRRLQFLTRNRVLSDSAVSDEAVVATPQEAAAVVLLRDVTSEELARADID